jgi:hypothetical protein
MFKPSGERAQWRVIYDELRMMNQGDVISYERLSELITRDARLQRAPTERAMKELEERDQRTLVCVRGVGYRIAAASEHEQIAHRHTVRSRRQLGKAAAKVRSADRSQLTREQGQRLDALEINFQQQAEIIERLEARDQERSTELRNLRREHRGDIAELNEQVGRVIETLHRHGISLPTPTGPSQPSEKPRALDT